MEKKNGVEVEPIGIAVTTRTAAANGQDQHQPDENQTKDDDEPC